MSNDKKIINKIIYISTAALAGSFVVIKLIEKMKKGVSVYKNEPDQQIGETDFKPGIYDKYIKRGIDIVLSFGGLVILSPLYAGIALAIVIVDPDPVLFTQKRMGQNKEYFKLHKFRSMKISTPYDVPSHMLENPEQYITKVGKFFCAHSLDEFPKIWDIFTGARGVIGTTKENLDFISVLAA